MEPCSRLQPMQSRGFELVINVGGCQYWQPRQVSGVYSEAAECDQLIQQISVPICLLMFAYIFSRQLLSLAIKEGVRAQSVIRQRS
jgi:hypothetical protein